MHQPLLQLKITPKQQTILILLYRFRFLTCHQIQQLLNHKNHHWVQHWLNQLTANQYQYLKRTHDPRSVTQAVIYSLGTKGRKYLKKQAIADVKPKLLDRVWREGGLSESFRQRCLLITDIYLSLLAQTMQNQAKIHFYTKTDLHGINYLINPSPDVYFANEKSSGEAKRFFLDIFDNIPPAAIRQRVRQYFDYYDSQDWQDHTAKPFPEIILVCPNDRLKHHLFGYIQKRLEDEPSLSIYLTTRDLIKAEGLCNNILQKACVRE